MSDCIISPNKTDKGGYAVTGTFRFGKRIKLSHVLAWVDANGRLPAPGMMICHTPMPGGHPRNCVNPDHLREDTRSGNTLDSVADGTHNMASKTHCKMGHEFTEKNTYRHAGRRHCRQCRASRW